MAALFANRILVVSNGASSEPGIAAPNRPTVPAADSAERKRRRFCVLGIVSASWQERFASLRTAVGDELSRSLRVAYVTLSEGIPAVNEHEGSVGGLRGGGCGWEPFVWRWFS